MRRVVWCAVVALGLVAGTGQAAPVDLLEADTQVFVQDNGAADLIYRLTFRENDSRSAIRRVGRFYEPIHFTRSRSSI